MIATTEVVAVRTDPRKPAPERLLPSDEGDQVKWAIGKANRKDGEVEVSLLDSPALKEQTLSKEQRKPERSRGYGGVIYCQRIRESDFAVGLELSGRVDSWARPY